MPVTYVTTPKVEINPFDNSTESILEVSSVVDASGKALPREQFFFAAGTPDADIRVKVEADLLAKGYVI